MTAETAILILLFLGNLAVTVYGITTSRDLFSPLPLFLGYLFYVNYFQPAYIIGIMREPLPVAESTLIQAQVLVLLASFFILIGYRADKLFNKRRANPKGVRNGHGRVGTGLIIFYALVWVTRIATLRYDVFFHLPTAGTYPRWLSLLNYLFVGGAPSFYVIAICLAVAHYYDRIINTLSGRLAFSAIALVEILVAQFRGWRSFLPILLITLLFVYNYMRLRKEKQGVSLQLLAGFVALGAVVLGPLGMILSTYRLGVARASDEASFESVTGEMQTSVAEFRGNDRATYLSAALISDGYINLCATIEYIASTGLFTHGDTLLMPIQRYLFQIQEGTAATAQYNVHNVYGRRIGVIGESQTNTNVTIPFVAELYMNFGVLGVMIGAWLIGVCFGRLYSSFRSHPLDTRNIVQYFFYWYFAVYLGAYYSIGVTLAYMILVKGLILLISLRFLFGARQITPVRVRAVQCVRP